AMALEKLGGEITRISDRLSERIAQSERRSQQALEDIGRRLVDSSSKIEQRYDRASGELAERMRLSEERTAALIAEARENIGRRPAGTPSKVAQRSGRPSGEPAERTRLSEGRTAALTAEARENIGRRAEPAAPAETVQPDWRAAAFPDAAFPDAGFPAATFDNGFEDPDFAEQQAWSADLAPPDSDPAPQARSEALTADTVFDAVMAGPLAEPATSAPFGSRAPEASAPSEAAPAPQAPAFATPTAAQPAPPAGAQASFGQGFGGADVSDALAAT